MESSKAFLKELEELKSRFDALSPELEVTVRDPSLGVEGHVVVWNTGIAKNGPLGPCGKGGTRISPDVTLDEVKMLAKIMALKNAAAGLPLGGSKSGLRGDPDAKDFEKQYRRFISLTSANLRVRGGIFGGYGFDIGAKPIHAIWACDQLKSTDSFTGKPLELGGSDYDREGIAGYGVTIAAAELVNFQNSRPQDCTIAIQGLGAMGAAVFRYCYELQFQVQYVSDPRIGGTFKLPGTVEASFVEQLIRQDWNGIASYLAINSCERFPVDAVLYQPVDIFFPCAVQGVVHEQNASQILAKNIVEGANNPCSAEARRLLWNRGITVIPDILANPGGVIAAYVELTMQISNEENLRTKAKTIEAKNQTRERITASVQEALRQSDTLKVDPTSAGLMRAYHAVLQLR